MGRIREQLSSPEAWVKQYLQGLLPVLAASGIGLVGCTLTRLYLARAVVRCSIIVLPLPDIFAPYAGSYYS